MKLRTSQLFFPLFALSSVSFAETSFTANVSGIESQNGSICYSLFAGPEGFPADNTKAFKSKCVPLSTFADANGNFDASSFKIEIPGLTTGSSYALAVFHDENSDTQLNTGLFGIPTESFGFSGNPPIIAGPPKYFDCTFFALGASQSINVELNNL